MYYFVLTNIAKYIKPKSNMVSFENNNKRGCKKQITAFFHYFHTKPPIVYQNHNIMHPGENLK